MIYPVTIIGNSVLRKVAKDIPQDYEGLDELVDNMFETMYKSDGIGLAGPQVNKSLRIFVIDGSDLAEEDPQLENFKQEFINARMVDYGSEENYAEEGCLSIPGIREEVKRPQKIRIRYYDRHFQLHEKEYDGLAARIIQHEYDHIEGVLFTDKISPLRKRMIRKKLANISKGKFEVDYKIQLA